MVNMVTATADVDGPVVDLGAIDLIAVLGGCVGAVGVVVAVDVGFVEVAAPAGFWAGCGGLAGVREFRFVVTAAFFARSHGSISGFSCSSRTEHPPVKH